MSLPIGTILGQRYELRAFIGSDGTLDVYRALDLRLGRDVAITVLEIHTIQSPEELMNFEKEAQVRAGLHHPLLMTIHDFGQGAGCAYQVAEWLEGQSLRKRLEKGPLSWQEARPVAEAVLEGLAVVHQKGHTLRILDATSVFLQREGHVKLFAYQMKSLHGGEILKAELEGLRALAELLLLTLGDGAEGTLPAVDPRILSTLRGWAREVKQDAVGLRKQFRDLVRDTTIPPPRRSKKHWILNTALVGVVPVLAVLGFQRFRTTRSAIQPPIPSSVPDPRPVHDQEASRLYLQGMALLDTLEPDNLSRAKTYLQSALARDPNDGLAHSGLGKCYGLMGLQRVLGKGAALRLSLAATQRALTLDPGLGEAHAALAFQRLWYAMDWPAAEQEYHQALALAPENAGIHRDFAIYLALRGRWEESSRQFNAALEREPLSRSSRTSLAVCLHWAGRTEASLEEFAKAIDQDRTSKDTLSNYREVLEQLGRIEESLRVSDRLAELEAIPYRDAVALRTAYEYRGLKGYWTVRVRQMERPSVLEPVFLAELVALQGDKERAFRLLRRAVREKSVHSARIPYSPALASLRADPRFRQLLQKMGYPDS
jgi:Tfp pilus assembly protein PilF